ncbi:MAG: AAA family ATPase [Planctomycetia bacterium]|nr:AAA family ATPase [Planctomycetia bacterium]
MQISSLIAGLSEPSAYPFATTEIEVCQTHISAVFLAGDFAYKVKKPVKLSFLDFSTLERRRHFCDEEVRLNRRLAPDVYLGVVPVTCSEGRAAFEGAGETIDWAVKMRRLPEAATLEQRVLRNEIGPNDVARLAVRLAQFHKAAARSEHIASFGRCEVVARNILENFAVAEPMTGRTISSAVRSRLTALTEAALRDLQPLIDARSAGGVTCDTHGDLHLDHVYLFPQETPPADLVIVDCIEFNERFRYTDPVADMAFLAMDLEFHGRRDLSAAFTHAYLAASADDEGRRLLPLYLSYRAAVRGKVDGLQLAEPEIPQAARDKALVRARGHWLLALNALEEPGKRACLVLVGGLPGTGKSTLAANLASSAGFQVLRSDVVRKELAGLAPDAPARDEFGKGLYTRESTDRTYVECLRRAESLLFDGQRVIVDATFLEEPRRRPFFEMALRSGMPALFLVCEADETTVRSRLATRRGDASDADWSVYVHAVQRWNPPRDAELRLTRPIPAAGPPATALTRAISVLHDAGLAQIISPPS